MTQWKLFDFDAHLDAFWEAWNEDNVQSELDDVMWEWCAQHAPLRNGAPPTWRRGEPLWDLSSHDRWDGMIEDAANENFNKIWRPSYSLYARTMKAQCLPVMDLDAFDEMVRESVHESYLKLLQEYEPKPGTLESLVMFGGRNFLSLPLAICARNMFPDSAIVLGVPPGTNNEFVLLPTEGIVFDIEDYILSTRHWRVQYVAFEEIVEH